MDSTWMSQTLAMHSQLHRLQRYLDVEERRPGQEKSNINPIFVAVDVETDSQTHQKLLEVGVSVLDTIHLQGRPFYDNAFNWRRQIKSYHYLIQEHEHIKLKYPPGCPDKFDFGKTDLINLRSVAFFLNQHCQQKDPETGELRKVILIGHAIGGDEKALSQNGWTPELPGTIVDTLDTQRVAYAIPHEGRKLQEGLGDMTVWLNHYYPAHFHNAGNDAHWTLVNMLLMGIRDEIPPVPPLMLKWPNGRMPGSRKDTMTSEQWMGMCRGVERWF